MPAAAFRRPMWLDGRQLLTEIKAADALATIPVVILTTSDVERDTLAAYRLGAAGYEDYWFSLVRPP